MGIVSGKPKPLRRSVKEVESDELTEFAKWEIMVDPYVPVKPELSQLKSWTLLEVRHFFDAHQKKAFETSAQLSEKPFPDPLIDQLDFMKLMPFSRTICDIMFKAFTNGSSNIYLMQGKLNVYEFVTMLLVMCYSNFSNKVKLLFRIFDCESKGYLTKEEGILFYKSFVVGYLRCTNQEIPTTERAINSANITFKKVDSNPDEKLEFEELQEFIETNEVASNIFGLYEPPIQLKEPQQTAAKFLKLTTIQSKALCKQAVEVFSDKGVTFKTPEEIFAQVLRISNKNVPLPEITGRFKHKKITLKLPKTQPNYMKLKRTETHENFQFKSHQKLTASNIFSKGRTEKSLERDKNNEKLRVVFNSVEPSSVAHTGYGHSSSDQLITNPRKMIAAGMIKLDNVHPGDPYYRLLIREYYLQKTKKTQCDSFGKLKATSLLKKNFKKLYDFFKTLSNGTNKIDILSFEKAFKGKDYMERVTSGLFNYLDKDNKGYITFTGFLHIFYPQLGRQESKAISEWAERINMHADDFGKMLKKDNPDKLNPRMNQRRMIGQRVTFDRYDTAYTGCKII